jgi:hypothetical protein
MTNALKLFMIVLAGATIVMITALADMIMIIGGIK